MLRLRPVSAPRPACCNAVSMALLSRSSSSSVSGRSASSRTAAGRRPAARC
ncbi:hypothetical protein ACFFMP_02640 [Pseudoroseomonas cervicalis]|uniref:hypothetical protein n=1 Tax=Teichococcus cervicalis TaxID=204525 RepID=UPI0035EBE716